MATITVKWGPFLKFGERWTPSRINQIFEGAAFTLEGSISAAQKPPGGIEGDWMSPTFITGLPTTVDPQGVDWALIHDTSAGKPQKVSLTNLLSLGFGSAAAVTTLTESDEFNVLVGGASKKISLPNVRNEIHDAPLSLLFGEAELIQDRLSVFDASASAAKKMTPGNLVRSVTDRVLVTTGSNAFVVNPTGLGITALVTGLRLIIKFHQAVLPAATLAVDGLTAKALRSADDGAITTGILAAGRIVELIYDSAATGGNGGWLVQGVGGVLQTNLRLDGTVQAIGGGYNASGGVFEVASGHGLIAGVPMWFENAAAPVGYQGHFPYYPIIISATTFRLAATKAAAAAGVALPVPDTTAKYYWHWASNPIIRSSNVDGVVKHVPGRYYIDFTNDLPDANYLIQLSIENNPTYPVAYAWVDGMFVGTGIGQPRTAAGFDVGVADANGYQDTPGLCVVVQP